MVVILHRKTFSSCWGNVTGVFDTTLQNSHPCLDCMLTTWPSLDLSQKAKKRYHLNFKMSFFLRFTALFLLITNSMDVLAEGQHTLQSPSKGAASALEHLSHNEDSMRWENTDFTTHHRGEKDVGTGSNEKNETQWCDLLACSGLKGVTPPKFMPTQNQNVRMCPFLEIRSLDVIS